MDFFDELGKKTTETYHEVKKQVSDFSEELKLKSKLNNLKERKNTLYTEIGEIVYSDIKDNKDVDRTVVTEKCDELTAVLEDISKTEMEILSYRKKRVCEGCGKKIDTEHKFCPNCGKEQPEIKREEPVVEESEVPAGETEAPVNETEPPVENPEDDGNQDSGENEE